MHPFTFCISLFYIINFVFDSLSSIYVVPSLLPSSSSSNREDGTLEYPYSTIEQAHDYLRTIFRLSFQRIALYPTYHFINHTLIFDEHDHLTIYTKIIDNERNQIQLSRKQNLIELHFPIISGGIRLTEWINDKGLNYLLMVDVLYVRSCLPTNGYFRYEKGLDNHTHLAYQGFIYREHQFDNITLSSTSTTEFIIYHSFTTSRHYFNQMLSQNRTILFLNPPLSIIGNTTIIKQSGQCFHLENIYDGMLIENGSFYFDSKTQILYYHAKKMKILKQQLLFYLLLK